MEAVATDSLIQIGGNSQIFSPKPVSICICPHLLFFVSVLEKDEKVFDIYISILVKISLILLYVHGFSKQAQA